MNEDLSTLTGESNYKKAPKLNLNQIALNGQTGSFTKKLMLEEKGEDGKYQKQDLGKELEVVFLKHRRRLFQYSATAHSFETNEHNHKDDRVMLYGPNEKGIASELREKYPGLRTQQIVYCFVPKTGETVRILIKGASLGSESTADGVMKYYDYLGSFKDEHSYQYKTILRPIQEQGKLGPYWCVSFVRGEKLTDTQLEKVAEKIKEVHAEITKMDDYFKNKNASEIIKAEDGSGSAPSATIEDVQIDDDGYPDDNIDPADIPF